MLGEVRVRGTATGPLFGPASNKLVDITVFDQARIAGGRIAEHWGCPTGSPCSPRPGYSTGWPPGQLPAGRRMGRPGARPPRN